MVDPALKGTRYGAALEAAEASAAAKRAARAEEMQQQMSDDARKAAQALRLRAIADQKQEQLTQENDDMTDAAVYSEAKLKILALGIQGPEFRLSAGLAGKATARLIEDKLIERLGSGRYAITHKGREEYKAATGKTGDDAPSEPDGDLIVNGVNVTKFMAPTPGTVPSTKTQESVPPSQQPTKMSAIEVAAMSLQNRQLTQRANENAETIDTLKEEIALLKQQLEDAAGLPHEGQDKLKASLEFYMTLVAPVIAAMNEEGYELAQLGEYVAWMRDRVKALAPLVDIERRYKNLQADVDAIINMITEDGSHLTLTEYVADLRSGLSKESAIVDDVNALAAADGQGDMDPRDYVRWLRAVLATSTTLTVLLEDMMTNDGMESMSLVDYLHDMRKKASVLDQSANKVEALTRKLEIAEAAQEQARHQSVMNEVNAFMACVLDDLAQIVPDVAEYRDNREAAQRAANRLRARK